MMNIVNTADMARWHGQNARKGIEKALSYSTLPKLARAALETALVQVNESIKLARAINEHAANRVIESLRQEG